MLSGREEKVAYFFLAPAMLIIILLIGYPFLSAIFLSLTNTKVGSTGEWIGTENFQRLLKSSVFQRVLYNSLVFTGISVFLKFLIGLLVAILLKDLIKWAKVIRIVILLPWVVPTSLSTLVWWWMFNPNFSVLNWILKEVGLRGIPWLSTSKTAMLAIILVNVWRGTPFFAISFLTGLVAIDRELYEVADVEGANSWQKFIRITLPLLKPVIAVVLLFSALMTVSEFNIIYVLTGGGPMYSTHLLATLAYQEGIATGDIGRGAAISVFLFPVLLMASYFQLRIVRRGVQQ